MNKDSKTTFESTALYKSEGYKNTDYSEYYQAQVFRHRAKMRKKRQENYYKSFANELLPHKNIDSKMLCMGTRNNHERDCFRKFLETQDVYSIDIAKDSKADYVLDFADLPKEWTGHWDFIFSNALDHARDATECVDEWIRILKPGGIMLLHLDTEDIGIEDLSAADCNSFSDAQVFNFLEERKDLVKVMQGSKQGPFIGGVGPSKYFANWPDLLIQKI
jgi:SAM-dependent methyltransferase